jgi:hypothetical protein
VSRAAAVSKPATGGHACVRALDRTLFVLP